MLLENTPLNYEISFIPRLSSVFKSDCDAIVTPLPMFRIEGSCCTLHVAIQHSNSVGQCKKAQQLLTWAATNPLTSKRVDVRSVAVADKRALCVLYNYDIFECNAYFSLNIVWTIPPKTGVTVTCDGDFETIAEGTKRCCSLRYRELELGGRLFKKSISTGKLLYNIFRFIRTAFAASRREWLDLACCIW